MSNCKRALTTACLVLAWSAAAQAAEPVTKTLNLGTLAVPGTLSYGNSFNDLAAGQHGIQIQAAGVPITIASTDRFHDQYAFDVAPAVASFITLTIDLGDVFNLDQMSASLYSGPSATLGTLGAASTLSALTPVALSVAGTGNPGSEVQVITAASLAGGHYVLDISGVVTGLFGGSYSGVVNLSPVPEPSSWALCLLGLGLTGLAARRRA